MAGIWSNRHTYELWLRVEIAVAEAWNEVGQVPDSAIGAIRAATFDEQRIERYEEESQHDLMAFLRSVNDGMGDAARYVHLGLTSNDVKDTALSLQMVEALDLIIADVKALRSTIGRLALEHRDTLMMGRTHGVHAEPLTFGFKMAVWFDDLSRMLGRLHALRKDVGMAKLAGAVGTHSNVAPEVEDRAARRLGLRPAAAETQVIQRDRHARYVLDLGVLGSVIDTMATEIRTLQRTEIGEVQEPFGEAQAGSSAMPHKRNPILSERISGLARVLRGYAVPALEDIVLWNERDISNSAPERVILPDGSAIVDYAVTLFNHVMSNLTIFSDRMRANIEATHGVVFSQRVLRALIEAGSSRDEAYRLIQRDSLRALDEGVAFEEVLKGDAEIRRYLSPAQIHELFDYHHFLKNIEATFRRVGLATQTATS